MVRPRNSVNMGGGRVTQMLKAEENFNGTAWSDWLAIGRAVSIVSIAIDRPRHASKVGWIIGVAGIWPSIGCGAREWLVQACRDFEDAPASHLVNPTPGVLCVRGKD